MIKELCTGLYEDTDVPVGSVRLEHDRQGYVEVYAAREIVTMLLIDLRWGHVVDLFAESPDGTYALPVQYLPNDGIPDGLVDLVHGLGLVQPVFSEVCQYPPCILGAERMVAGFSLCQHHGGDLLGHEALVA